VTERELELEIVDDGKGLPQDFDPLTGAGLGFRLVRALTAQLGIRSGFESSIAGTRFWLRVERAPETTTGVLASSMNGLAGAANSESS
jgi:two-component sensor histidine kinase